MAGNTFGKLFRVTTAGVSHGPGYMVIVDGCPPGLSLAVADIQHVQDISAGKKYDMSVTDIGKKDFPATGSGSRVESVRLTAKARAVGARRPKAVARSRRLATGSSSRRRGRGRGTWN